MSGARLFLQFESTVETTEYILLSNMQRSWGNCGGGMSPQPVLLLLSRRREIRLLLQGSSRRSPPPLFFCLLWVMIYFIFNHY